MGGREGGRERGDVPTFGVCIVPLVALVKCDVYSGLTSESMTVSKRVRATETRLLVSTAIPWRTIKGRELEECLYWLIDDLGGQDLQWRTGTTGKSSPDQGRDIEASFYTSNPASELIREKWWFEAKGRDKVVESSAVHNSLVNVLARDDIDVMVVATNAAFSNPTRDWVSDWQKKHPRPRVRLWDRHDLERLMSRHPATVLRLFPNALTPQGKLNAATERFWNYVQYIDSSTLSVVWEKRRSLNWDTRSALAFIASEFANGNIEERSWSNTFKKKSIIQILQAGLNQLLHFCFRAEDIGTRTEPYTDAVAYLMLRSVQLFPDEIVARAIRRSWPGRSKLFDRKVQDWILQRLFKNTADNLLLVCASDCERITHSGTDTPVFRDWRKYWERFGKREKNYAKRASEKYSLIMEKLDAPCKVGFQLDREHRCPLNIHNTPPDPLPLLAVFRAVVRFRSRNKMLSRGA